MRRGPGGKGLAVKAAASWGSPGARLRAGLRGIALAASLMAAGCATPPEDPTARAAYDEAADPLEPFNRFMFDVHQAIDGAVLKPVATAYRDVVPEPLRDALRNLLRNLRAPLILTHDLLQGEPGRAAVTFQRFLVNSAFGFAGLVDVADLAIGLKFHDEDFGQTLGVWGMDEGFYLFLPVIGPSSGRDALGLLVDSVIDPVSLLFAHYDVTYGPFARAVLTALDQRSRAIETLDDVERTSIDFYAALRSLYRQKRDDEILNGRPAPPGRRVPSLEAPAAATSDRIAPVPVAVSPAAAGVATASAAPIPAPAIAPAPRPEGAGAAPPVEARGVDWSAWTPALAFNPPRISDAPPLAAPPVPSAAPAPAPAPVPATPRMQPAPQAQPAVYRPGPFPAPAIQPAAYGPQPAAAGADAPAATVLFRPGSAALNANDRALLHRLAATAQARGASLRVVGHAAERMAGMDELTARFYNFDLSWARASAAAEELERAGQPFQRIVIEARGDTEPLRATGAGDAPDDRRVSVYLQ
jgi:phospholipid-binding lipoprotein MlaA